MKRVAGHEILMKDQLLRGQNNWNIIRITSSQLSHFIHTKFYQTIVPGITYSILLSSRNN